MNGVPEEYIVSFTQTAKGVFYVDKLSVKADSKEKILTEIDYMLEQIKKRLEHINDSE